MRFPQQAAMMGRESLKQVWRQRKTFLDFAKECGLDLSHQLPLPTVFNTLPQEKKEEDKLPDGTKALHTKQGTANKKLPRKRKKK